MLALLAAPQAEAVMVDLGTLSGTTGEVEASGVSGDGKTVVGRIGGSQNNQLFMWSSSQGFTKLGPLYTNPLANAAAVSGDGRVNVGNTSSPASRAMRWTAASGFSDLGTLGGSYSLALALSHDGNVVVGYSATSTGDEHAFRWDTTTNRMIDLGALQPTDHSRAQGVSGDGVVVVGRSGSRAFRWTATAGMTDIGDLGGNSSGATGANRDGSVIVGYSATGGPNGNEHAFRWTAAKGMQDLGTLGGLLSTASGTNADGSVVVGSAQQQDARYRAFRWTETSGMRNLGVLSGADNSYATGVSDDGNTIVGTSGSRAFIWTPDSPAMQDLAYLQTSLILSADTVNHLMASQQRRLRDLNQTHCQPVGNQRACLGLDATTYRGEANGEGNQRNLQFAGGLRLNEHYAVGANAVLGASELDVQSAEQRKAFALGLWAAYQQNPDATGWGADASVAAGQSDNSFERGVNLTDVQRAHAQLDMKSTTLRLAAHYGLQLHGSLVTPEIALSHQRTEQNGFTERNVAFPLTVNASSSRDTYASLGVRSATKMSPQGTLHLSLAVDTLLSDDTPDIQGSSKVPGLSHFTFATSLEKRRAVPVAMAGYSHAIDANSTVGGGVQLGASPYQGERAVLGVGVQYRYAF